MVCRCWVEGCFNIQGCGKALFSVSKLKKDVLAKVLQDLGLSKFERLPPSFRICCDHFTESSYFPKGNNWQLVEIPIVANAKIEAGFFGESSILTFNQLRDCIDQVISLGEGWEVNKYDDFVELMLRRFENERGTVIEKQIVINRSVCPFVWLSGEKFHHKFKKFRSWGDLKGLFELVKETGNSLSSTQSITKAITILGAVGREFEAESEQGLKKLSLIVNQLQN